MDIIAKARVYRAIIEKAMATADEQLIAKAPTLVKHWAVNEAVVPGIFVMINLQKKLIR